MPVNDCTHPHLELMPGKKTRLRCRRCHLTIEAAELGESHCPECYAAQGRKYNDFEELAPEESEAVRYRCEDCGAIIESQ
ncbi:MAG: phage terminase large subunit family protein [Desulfobacterales bacterium]|nr:phage terminase large subunit family protein [Desulfobacterales bacterium]